MTIFRQEINFLPNLKALMAEFKTYQDMIEKTLDLESITTKNLFLVNSSFNPQLAELRIELTDIENKINKVFTKV